MTPKCNKLGLFAQILNTMHKIGCDGRAGCLN